MSFSVLAESIATRKVIGWSFPLTLRTWANPSSAPALEILRTRAESTLRVSTVVLGPKIRSTDSASFFCGADWARPTEGEQSITVARATAAPLRLELIPNAKAQQLTVSQTRLSALQLVVAFEHHVIEWLIGQSEGGYPP